MEISEVENGDESAENDEDQEGVRNDDGLHENDKEAAPTRNRSTFGNIRDNVQRDLGRVLFDQ